MNAVLQRLADYGSLVRRGAIDDNTIFRLSISLCPAVATTSDIRSAVLMGVAVLFVQTMVSVVISALRSLIHPRIRLPVYMVIIAGWVTVTDMLLDAFAPEIYKQISLYIQLIVAFASILAGAEMFASKNSVVRSFFDGFGRGAGFLLALVFISVFRELIGKGTLGGLSIFPVKPFPLFALPAGGFIIMGILMAFFSWLGSIRRQRRERNSESTAS
jgi:electron transport complex protein RnfE